MLAGVRRSWLAVVGVLGLVGSLLVVGVLPAAGADDDVASHGATYSACVGAASVSVGFSDVVGSFAEDSVNCLAHYGITTGRAGGMFDPGAPVLRWQMALFMARAAGLAGIVLPVASDQGFSDVGGVFEAGRMAIDQVVELGIMSGVSSSEFGPDVGVSRASMAVILDAFLSQARLSSGALGGEVAPDYPDDVMLDDVVFDDIGRVSVSEDSAIRRMFEVGVTLGTSDNKFSPGGLVTRGQMAVFIARMLAHTVARPAGLTLQVDKASVTEGESVDLAVSLRSADHMALPDEYVDLFSAAVVGDAFSADGSCSNDVVLEVLGIGPCEVTNGDEVTDPDGDVFVTHSLDASATVWAWSGDLGDEFDSDSTVTSSVRVVVAKAGGKLRVTDSLAENAGSVRFGERVVVTFQVVDAEGNPAAEKGVKVRVANHQTVESDGSTSTSARTKVHETDAAGRVMLSFRQVDPRSGSDMLGDRAWLNLGVTLVDSDLVVDDKTKLGMVGSSAGSDRASATVLWSDAASVLSSLKLSQSVSYHEASVTGQGASNTVVATVTDQYGDPMPRVKVQFASDDPEGIGATKASGGALAFYDASRLTLNENPPSTPTLWGTHYVDFLEDVDPNRGLMGVSKWERTTSRLGLATFTYNRKSNDSSIETIVARVKAELDHPLALARSKDVRHEDKWDARSGDVVADRVYHYWGQEPGGDDAVSGRLIVADTDSNRLVLAGGNNTVSLVSYDSNDQFNSDDGAITLADFEKGLKDDGKHLEVDGAYSDDAKDINRFTYMVEWDRLYPVADDKVTAADMMGRFGTSFAADDGVIVVGAPRTSVVTSSTDDTMLSRVGMVYVFDGVGDDDPVMLTIPEGTDRVANSYFGNTVDIGGDAIVVGTRVGVAYVFNKAADGDWAADTPGVKLENGHASLARNFGRQVAISGETIVVGAAGGVRVFPKAHTGGSDVDAFENSDGIALVQTGMVPTATGGGRDLAFDGETIVAGSFAVTVDDNPSSGVVYVYAKPTGGWAEDTDGTLNGAVKLNSPDPQAYGFFGRGVAVADGVVVVGQANDPNARLVRVSMRCLVRRMCMSGLLPVTVPLLLGCYRRT